MSTQSTTSPKQLPFALKAKGITLESIQTDELSSASFVTFKETKSSLPTKLGKIQGLRRQLATYRLNPWSLAPAFGSDPESVPDETVMLLWENEQSNYGVLIPLVSNGHRAWLAGTPQGLELRTMPWDPAVDSATLLFYAEGTNPFTLVQESVSLIAERLRTFRTRTQKSTPEWVDWFGWCTWDAFYYDVNTQGVLDGLEKAKAGGISPRFMILDDGWQDTDGKMLQGFGAHPKKIPDGLANLITEVKSRFDVRLFGAWHAFQGYWYGIDPESPIGKHYRTFDLTQKAHNRPTEEAARRVLIHPDDIARFYNDYYRELREAGVDFVKVDNQGSLDHFMSPETTPPTATMQRYQEAFQGAAAHHFSGETLHCLSQTGDVLFHLNSSNVMRNSEDYFPKRAETQGQHVFRNALNNVFMSQFCLPDWDMFQSCQAPAPFHAAARAICGGPIYISDKPGEQNFELIRKLITSEGKALRCPQPALPTRDCLFSDANSQKHLLKIQNKNGERGVLGLFNCHWNDNGGESVSGHYCVNDVEGLRGERFALYSQQTDTVTVSKRDTQHSLSLEPLGWDIMTLAPIEQGVAIIGLTNKLNSSAALISTQWLNSRSLQIKLHDGGYLTFYSERAPEQILVNSTPVAFTQSTSNTWHIDIPVQAEPTVILQFSV